jgi:hypothetical protein
MKEGISKEIINILVFIGLCFLGITGRISYDVEIKGIKYKFWSFINRLFVGTIICYIIQIFLFKFQMLKEFYSGIILTLSFFSIDIISFFTNNFNIIIVYILNLFLKSFKDTVEGITKAAKNNKK